MGVYFCSPTACNNLVPLGSPPRLGVPTSAKSDNRPRLQQSANRSSASYPLFLSHSGLTGGKGKEKKKREAPSLSRFFSFAGSYAHTYTPSIYSSFHLIVTSIIICNEGKKIKIKKVPSNHHDYRPFPNHQHRHCPQPKIYCFIVLLYYWIIFKGCTTPLPNK